MGRGNQWPGPGPRALLSPGFPHLKDGVAPGEVHGKTGGSGMRSPAPTAHPEASWGWVKSWPYWPGASDPFTLASLPCQGTTLTHHAVLGRCVIADHQHDRAAAGTEEEGRLAWAPERGGGQCVRGPAGWRGRATHRSVLALGTVPGRLMSRSLRLQTEAEAGIPGRDPRAGCWSVSPSLTCCISATPSPSTWQLRPNIPPGAGLVPDSGLTLWCLDCETEPHGCHW